MTVTLTIKQVPAIVAARLRRRAEGNRRSLQRELLLIVETAAHDDVAHAPSTKVRVAEPPAPVYAPRGASARGRGHEDRKGRLSLEELWQRARKLGAAMPSESAAIVRKDRDAGRR